MWSILCVVPDLRGGRFPFDWGGEVFRERQIGLGQNTPLLTETPTSFLYTPQRHRPPNRTSTYEHVGNGASTHESERYIFGPKFT